MLWIVAIMSLAACTPLPNVPPPDAPIIFEAPYNQFFDATLEAMTLAYVDRPGRIRYDFAVSQAVPETGLISAFRDDARVRYRRSYRNISIDYDDDIVEVDVFVPVQELERSIVTAIVRPVNDAQSSLVYSTTSDTGSTVIANAYMGDVLARLEARFARLN